MESRLRLELREKVCRLAGDMHDTRDFACSHLFERDRVIDEDLLRVDVKAIEQNAAGQVRRTPHGVEAYLLARKIFERLDLGTNVDVHLIDVERADVTNSVLDVGEGAVAGEFVEHVGRRDRDVDALEIEQVFDVAESPVSHHRQHAKLGSVVQDLGHFGCKTNVGAFEQPARDADGPLFPFLYLASLAHIAGYAPTSGYDGLLQTLHP